MPKSKRAKVVHLTQVTKKTREHKERLFESIRECIPQYQHCFVFGIDNMRNTYLKTVRQELTDSRLFFGKTKLMSKALGHSPEDSYADNIYKLTPYLKGTVGLIFTNQSPQEIQAYFAALSHVDFARAGAVAPRDFVIPYGVVHSTAGGVPTEHDVPLGHTVEPELRRLGVPTRMVKGRVVLEEPPEGGEGLKDGGIVVCRKGDVLDSRQTRLLKLFSVCLSEFRVKVLAYWSAANGEVTEVDAEAMEGVEDAVVADSE
ncbi:Uu.00g004410.m01.CDS01 [Anthostomella pinea]|uniref:Ribosome assembly factor mrt4 n=1 Tax=Anthostomella pinea TaxID=933095 RepID=A0AAI8VKW8_9PEZI|nr:Uu.00g004410.m01.CDS01 [Anthostomella pinea]